MRDIREIKSSGAGCRLYLANTPVLDGLKTAVFGSFFAENIPEGVKLVKEAKKQARKLGFSYLIGPMDQDTWHSYRLMTETDGRPFFFLEPNNPLFYKEILRETGFKPIATYSSAVDCDLIPKDMESFRQRIAEKGIRIRQFDLKQINAELSRIYHFSRVTFAGNYLYKEISENIFKEIYQRIIPYIEPRYFLFAEDLSGQIKAFLFAILDYNQSKSPNHLIIKTYASTCPGLGHLLVDNIQRVAKQQGIRAIIHALMHDRNVSKNTSDKYGQTFRRYALYGLELSK